MCSVNVKNFAFPRSDGSLKNFCDDVFFILSHIKNVCLEIILISQQSFVKLNIAFLYYTPRSW